MHCIGAFTCACVRACVQVFKVEGERHADIADNAAVPNQPQLRARGRNGGHVLPQPTTVTERRAAATHWKAWCQPPTNQRRAWCQPPTNQQRRGVSHPAATERRGDSHLLEGLLRFFHIFGGLEQLGSGTLQLAPPAVRRALLCLDLQQGA